MKINNLAKNIATILNNKYIVPLYQRNFAWGDDEISQLLQDIYESFEQNKSDSKKGNYYLGSLIVIKRKNGDYEVIDGQQRLTAIMLIAKILNPDIKELKLFYDSRPEVEDFFNLFYQKGNTHNVNSDTISHLVDAVDYIKNAKLNSNDNHHITIEKLNEKSDHFKDYFFNNVILVFVELPQVTDVANYFEIMNNRGQQLQKHEIIKAKLLDKIKNDNGKYDQRKQKVYSKIWNACSQMNTHIQKLFVTDVRKILFGDNYSNFPKNDKIESLIRIEEINNNSTKKYSIDHILNQGNINQGNNQSNNNIDDIEDEGGDDKAIIDFPNFLMHILKIKYNETYKNIIKSSKKESDIPLNEKYLIDVYNKIEKEINAEDFIMDLLYYRTVFDKYIVKATTSENSEDSFEWTLKQPEKTNNLKYKNTFENEQERIIKCLSMLQVTFSTRIYKNWLQKVLGWFKNNNDSISENDYRKKLDELIMEYYRDIEDNIDCYSQGTDTPHFLFNFIDYLYWVDSKNKKTPFKFDFRYRNSIEHHLPQSFEGNNYSEEVINNLGNLCLVSKSSNSRMNNESPKGKADKNGKYYKDNSTPKRKIMYDMTNKKQSWGKEEIEQHYKDIVKLLSRREDILK